MLIWFLLPMMIRTTIVSSRIDFNKLVGSQYSNTTNKTYLCRLCLYGFSNHYSSRDKAQHRRTGKEMTEKLEEHEKNCFGFAAQRTEFPDEPVVKFVNIQKQVKAPFTVYADFEGILKKLSCDGNKYQEHVTCSYAYQIVSRGGPGPVPAAAVLVICKLFMIISMCKTEIHGFLLLVGEKGGVLWLRTSRIANGTCGVPRGSRMGPVGFLKVHEWAQSVPVVRC